MLSGLLCIIVLKQNMDKSIYVTSHQTKLFSIVYVIGDFTIRFTQKT